jgi:hypothetical protein
MILLCQPKSIFKKVVELGVKMSDFLWDYQYCTNFVQPEN